MKLMQKYTTDYTSKLIQGLKILIYKGKGSIPAKLQGRIIEWYDEYLHHPGEVRSEETIGSTVTWAKLK